MVSTKFTSFYAISSIASAHAFITTTNKQFPTRLQYRELNDDSFTKRQLPTGAFGILPLPTAEQDASIDTNTYTFNTVESEPFITQSYVQSTSYSPNLDLPASADKGLEFEKAMEVSIGRVAMMAAIVLIATEILTGASFPEQFLQLGGLQLF